MILNGKVAIVTGGTKGIGRAIAEALAREGMNVCISARIEDEVERTVAELDGLSERGVAGAVCDVRDYDEVKALFEHTVAEFGGVDVLINNAGIGLFGRVEEMRPEDFRAVLETNLFGVFYCCRAASKSGRAGRPGSDGREGGGCGQSYSASRARRCGSGARGSGGSARGCA